MDRYTVCVVEYNELKYSLVVVVVFRELSKFIASGRLHCSIDKVGGVVETNRPDSKNFLYQVKTTLLS